MPAKAGAFCILDNATMLRADMMRDLLSAPGTNTVHQSVQVGVLQQIGQQVSDQLGEFKCLHHPTGARQFAELEFGRATALHLKIMS